VILDVELSQVGDLVEDTYDEEGRHRASAVTADVLSLIHI